jgi:cyclophilin family peptidyl-prolyl cis-trans isomerase
MSLAVNEDQANSSGCQRRPVVRMAHDRCRRPQPPVWASLVAAAALTVPAFAGDEMGPPTLHPRVQVQTTMGDFVLELDAELAPLSVLSFVEYVRAGFYDGTIFHRVVQGTVIQGGAYLPDMKEKLEGLRPATSNESFNDLKNQRGTIALFRIPGNLNSARAQFFINVTDNPQLDRLRDGGGYTVFGRVVDGTETIEKIRNTPVGAHPKYAAGRNPVVPVTPVVIKAMRLLNPLEEDAARDIAKIRDVTPDVRLNAVLKRLEAETGAKAVATESGLRYLDVREGTGALPLSQDAIEVRYRGTLLDGREFDNTEDNEGGTSIINMESFVKGLREGLATVREGGKRILIVPPELAYGKIGIPGHVPSDATLVYDFEVLSIKPPVKKPDIPGLKEGGP